VQPGPDLTLIIQEAAAAMGKEQYDQAVYLLKQVKAHGYHSRFINIDALLEDAEASLERQTYRREAENAYRQIAVLLEHEATFKFGCDSLAKFLKELPDYDPLKLAQKCRPNAQSDKPDFSLPLLQWCAIPAGKVFFQPSAQESGGAGQFHEVKAFHISKYPITNAQVQAFINHPEGYRQAQRWCLSPAMKQWYDEHSEPQASKFKGDERPREMVTWYEALVFCQWLGEQMQRHVWLPSIYEWQRAFQGDDQRAYPWGNSLDIQRCNVAEGELKATSIVTRYDNGVSPFGVYDMAGNIWEWCINSGQENGFNPDFTLNTKRMVRGGSFISPGLRSNASFHYALLPESKHASIGFRVAYYD
jgi:formylglycine-generating enzyme required for sulfatase activity